MMGDHLDFGHVGESPKEGCKDLTRHIGSMSTTFARASDMQNGG
jgi:hypothetical protein